MYFSLPSLLHFFNLLGFTLLLSHPSKGERVGRRAGSERKNGRKECEMLEWKAVEGEREREEGEREDGWNAEKWESE